MNRFEVTEEISASAEKVWGILADLERWTEWTASMKSIVPLVPGPIGLGAKYRVSQPQLAPTVWKVTVFESGKNFTWETSSPGIRMTGEHLILPGTTVGRVQVKLAFQLEGILAPILNLLFSSIIRRYVDMEAKGLRQRSEASV